jgi:hypothetical protein
MERKQGKGDAKEPWFRPRREIALSRQRLKKTRQPHRLWRGRLPACHMLPERHATLYHQVRRFPSDSELNFPVI